MVSRPKLRLFRYLVPVIIVLAFIFSFRQCGKQEKPAGHPRDYAAIDTGIRPGQRTQNRNNTYYEFRRAVGRIKRGTL